MSLNPIDPSILVAPTNSGTEVALPMGIPGFPELTTVRIDVIDDYGMFVWLSSEQLASAAFLAVNPFVYFPDYDVELTDADSGILDVHDEDELIVFCLVTLDREEHQASANMLAPIVVNITRGLAHQVILEGQHDLRKPLPMPPSGKGITADVAVLGERRREQGSAQ